MTAPPAADIKESVRQEFAEIRLDIQRHMLPEVTIEHSRRLLTEHVYELVLGRAQLLLDSLLNCLMEDASRRLGDASTELKNRFYARNLRADIKARCPPALQTLSLSRDPRLLYGSAAAGGALLVTVVAIFGIGRSRVPPVLVGPGAVVVGAVAFRVAFAAGARAARRKLYAEVAAYLDQAESEVIAWLSEVECAFVGLFDDFLTKFSARSGGAS